VDDHPLLRHGLRQVISTESRFEVVGEASDGRSGLEEMRRSKPEVVILDITLPGMNGLDVVGICVQAFHEQGHYPHMHRDERSLTLGP
jgi:YesN/AraC family two-component response regulator